MAKWGEIKCPRCDEQDALWEGMERALEESDAREARLEAKLAKLTKAADRVHDSYWYSSDGIIVGMRDLSEALREARITLAELNNKRSDEKGQDDE